MNKLLTKIVGAVLGASMAVGVGVGVAINNDRKDFNSEVNAAVTPGNYTLTIADGEIDAAGSGSGYAAYNGDGTYTATYSTYEMDVVVNQYQVMNQSSKTQFQTNKGVLYNKTNLMKITKITLESTTNMTIKVGTTENPSSGTTVTSGSSISGNNGYFYIKGGSSTPKPGDITIEFTISKVAVTGVSLNKNSTSIGVGATETLTATVSPNDATNKAVTWSSDDDSIASVNSSGVITGVAAGSTTITATSQDDNTKSASCTVTVTAPVAVSSVSLNKDSTTIMRGDTETLTATVLPNDASNKAVTWSSDAEGVATVDQNGVVTAVAAGTAHITATSQDDNTKSASCTITVVAPLYAADFLDFGSGYTKGTVYSDQTVNDTVSISGKTLGWQISSFEQYGYMLLGDYSTSNGAWDTFSAMDSFASLVNGLTANSIGSANRTYAMFTRSFGVVNLSKVKVSWTGNNLSSGTQKMYILATNNNGLSWSVLNSATAAGGTTTAGSVTWSNASTYSDGKTVGIAFVFTSTTSGNAGCRGLSFEMFGSSIDYSMSWKAASVSISGDSTVEVGQTKTLTATLASSYATDTVTWSSSDEDIATVGSNTGIVTGVSEGNVTITATTSSGKTANKSITVIAATIHVSKVELNKTSLSIQQAGSASLVATVSPAEATVKTVSWSITGDADISVDQNGVVSVANTASVGDTATVTVTTTDGGKTATCSITVTAFTGDYIKVSNTHEIHAGMVVTFGNFAKQSVATGFNDGTAGKDYITSAANNATIIGDGLVANTVLEFTIGGKVNNWTFKDNDGNYLGLASNSNNYVTLDKSNEFIYWTISITDGSVTITNNEYNTLYFNSSSPRFSNYGNAQAAFELYAKPSNDSVLNFIRNNMRMGDTSLTSESDTGACKSTGNNYYLTAKSALADLSQSERDDFETNSGNKYTEALNRYNAWARACNDGDPFDGETTVVTPLRTPIIVGFSNESSTTTVVVIIISVLTLTTLGGYFLLRKRKEEN